MLARSRSSHDIAGRDQAATRLHCRPHALVVAVAAWVAPAFLCAQEAAIPAFKQLDSMEARVQGCVTCHGQSGQGTSNGYFPRIAGKPAGYLYNQLVAFRDGTRKYPPMNYLVAYLPDTLPARDRRALREAAAALRAERGRADDRRDPLARGQALATAGDAPEGHPGLRRLPWRGSHGHGARHPGAGRACARPTSRRS